MAALPIDYKAYGALLAEAQPAVIANDEEHAAAIRRMTDVMKKEEKATPEELRLLGLYAIVVEEYERTRWRHKRQTFSPREMLAFLIEEQGLKQTDLDGIASQSNISAILAGRRPIGKLMALKLAERFHVSPDLFL